MLRLSGAAAGVKAARLRLGGEVVADDIAFAFWRALRDQRDAFFQSAEPLWRVSVPPTTPPLALMMPQWIEWGGGLRWHRGPADAAALRIKVAAAGGHVTLFRHGDKSAGVFHPLQPALVKIHRDLKAAFDPENIFNRGRMDNF
jgi:glycolate oxidase FAD binding subunit